MTRRDGFSLGLGRTPLPVGLANPPEWVAFVVLLLASAAAGWVLADAPVRAGALVFAPTAILLVVVAVVTRVPAVVFPLVGGLAISLVASHVGAGAALRRRPSPSRS